MFDKKIKKKKKKKGLGKPKKTNIKIKKSNPKKPINQNYAQLGHCGSYKVSPACVLSGC